MKAASVIVMLILIVLVIGRLQELDDKARREMAAESAVRQRTYDHMISTCPASDPKADQYIAFLSRREGQVRFEFCVPMRPKSSYSPATQSILRRG